MAYALESGVTDSTGHSLVGLIGEFPDASSTPLGAGASFTCATVDMTNWTYYQIGIVSDQSGTVNIQVSLDGITWANGLSLTYPGGATGRSYNVGAVAPFIRGVYVNGATPQGAFVLSTRVGTSSTKWSSTPARADIAIDDDAELTRAILSGKHTSGLFFETIKTEFGGHLSVALGDSANLDAFSRLRISNPDTVFDSTFEYDLQPLAYEQLTANSGTIAHVPARACAALTTAAVANSRAVMQSRAYHRYIPGKSQLIIQTGFFGSPVAGIKKRVGYYDDNNGFFFEQNGTDGVRFIRRSNVTGSVVDTVAEQAAWNLDTLDGSLAANSTGIHSNASGLTLDPTKVFIIVFDMQWLGMGRIRCGFDIDGRVRAAHQFLDANVGTTVYMRTPNLPTRWEILGNGVATMDAVCCSVQSEGGNDKFLSYQFAYNRAVVTAGNGTQVLAFNIRPKATFNSITNRSQIRILDVSTLVSGANPVLTEIYYGTTVGGAPSWTDADATNSGLQVDLAGTPSGGVKVASYYSPAGAQFKTTTTKELASRYPIVMDLAGTGYTNVTVYVTGYTGTSTCYTGFAWEEVR